MLSELAPSKMWPEDEAARIGRLLLRDQGKNRLRPEKQPHVSSVPFDKVVTHAQRQIGLLRNLLVQSKEPR